MSTSTLSHNSSVHTGKISRLRHFWSSSGSRRRPGYRLDNTPSRCHAAYYIREVQRIAADMILMKTLRLTLLLLCTATASLQAQEDFCAAINNLLHSAESGFQHTAGPYSIALVGRGQRSDSSVYARWTATTRFETREAALQQYIELAKKLAGCSFQRASLEYGEKVAAQLNTGWSKTGRWTLPADHPYGKAYIIVRLSKAEEDYQMHFEVTTKPE